MHKEVSVLISSSPIVSHPSTAIIEETVASIRYHLPDAPLFIMFDGVRPEQEHYREVYREYIQRVVSKAISEWGHARLFPHREFLHQAEMTRRTLESVTTPMILFCEHDTPLVDKPIDWKMLQDAILTYGATNHVRLHYDDQIHPEHEHMMCGKLTPNLIKCVQFHQRPHLANAQWYRELLATHFTENSRTFIEDVVYSPVSCAPWESYKLTIYDPEGTGKNMKRSRDLNGRAGEQKYPMVF